MNEVKMLNEVLGFLADDPLFAVPPANLGARTIDGDTILQRLILRARPDLALLALSLGVDPNLKGDMGNTALHYLVEKGRFDKDLFDQLLRAGAEMEARNEFGCDVRKWARESGNEADLTLG